MKGMKVHWGKTTYGMMRYMRMVAPGHYQLKWQDDVVDIRKVSAPQKARSWHVSINGSLVNTRSTLDGAMHWVANVWGNEPVMTYNMLNRAAGEFQIARKNKGGCCDPATERYHCM